jgi:hypothetical protein
VKRKKSVGEQRKRRIVIIDSDHRKRIRPMILYLYAMKSPATKEKYLMKLGKFLDFLNLLVYVLVLGIISLGNVQPIKQEGKIVASRMIVYAGEDDSYITYITPSAYRELAEWMKYREESGEIITSESWVMRDLWDTRVKIK